MKKILLSFLVVSLFVNFADAQGFPGSPGNSGTHRKKPKKPKGNHSNHKLPSGFTSINSVMYSSRANEDVTSATLMTPTGWGSDETFAFATAGGTPQMVYTSNPDAYAQVGFGAGNSRKFVSVVGILNINDVSALDNYSATFIVSRQLSNKSSVSVGAMHLFADPFKTDAGESFYVAYSRMISNKLNYTVGVGTGRFMDNSEMDVKAGRSPHGTAVFGSLSYQATKNVNVNAEWTGNNIALSSSVRVKQGWPVLSFGVSDLTRLSSDKPYFMIGIGQALVFNKHK